jgi:hypothetical protein
VILDPDQLEALAVGELRLAKDRIGALGRGGDEDAE